MTVGQDHRPQPEACRGARKRNRHPGHRDGQTTTVALGKRRRPDHRARVRSLCRPETRFPWFTDHVGFSVSPIAGVVQAVKPLRSLDTRLVESAGGKAQPADRPAGSKWGDSVAGVPMGSLRRRTAWLLCCAAWRIPMSQARQLHHRTPRCLSARVYLSNSRRQAAWRGPLVI